MRKEGELGWVEGGGGGCWMGRRKKSWNPSSSLRFGSSAGLSLQGSRKRDRSKIKISKEVQGYQRAM